MRRWSGTGSAGCSSMSSADRVPRRVHRVGLRARARGSTSPGRAPARPRACRGSGRRPWRRASGAARPGRRCPRPRRRSAPGAARRRAGPRRPPACGRASRARRRGRSRAATCGAPRSGCSAPRPTCRRAAPSSAPPRGPRPAVTRRAPAGSVTASSSTLSAVRASPSARRAIERRAPLGSTDGAEPAQPALGIRRARARRMVTSRSPRRAGAARRPGSATAARALTSNDGFSVVAPTRMMVPFSTWGRKASCWAWLKRWISSTKRIVRRPRRAPSASASVITWRISLTPESTAENGTKRAPATSASRRASVVLPVPGGPHRIIECSAPCSSARRNDRPGPVSCGWPTTSSRLRGRMRSASGAGALGALLGGGVEPKRSSTRAVYRFSLSPRGSRAG